MKYLHFFFIGIIIVAIVAFLLGKNLAASWLVILSSSLSLVAIALAAFSWFNQQQSSQAYMTELNQNLAEQERRNQKLEQSLSQARKKLAEQEQQNAEQEQQNQELEQSLSQVMEKLAEQEQHSQKFEQYRQELDDAQVGFNHALAIMVSYQMAIQPIPGNHRGDCFVEKTSLDQIHERSMRSVGCWLRVIQNKDNEHSKDIREMLEGESATPIDLHTLENAIRELISLEDAESA